MRFKGKKLHFKKLYIIFIFLKKKLEILLHYIGITIIKFIAIILKDEKLPEKEEQIYHKDIPKTKDDLLLSDLFMNLNNENFPYLEGFIHNLKSAIDMHRKKDIKKLINRENWMRDILFQDNIANQKYLWSISIPGTHHSAVWDVYGFGKEYSICQNIHIEEQLNGGIRFFDLRVCDNKTKSNDIWISHHFVAKVTFYETFMSIVNFIKNHEKEIVIISITADIGRTLSKASEKKIQDIVIQECGNMLILDNDLSKNLNTLISHGKKIAITGNLFPNACKRESSWIKTKSKSYKKLIHNITDYLHNNPIYKLNTITMLESQVTNRGISAPNDWNARKLNPKLPKKLKKEWGNYDINVFLHDFTDDNIIDTVISRNILLK